MVPGKAKFLKYKLVMSIVGARPQFIKLAPLAKSLAGKFRHIIVHSGQHYDDNMSAGFFKELQIPDANVNLGVGSGAHGQMTAEILARCEKQIVAQIPDIVLVYGDTNTTLAGALAAAKMNVPVGHIEAGLRSFRKDMPEEINRVLTDHVSDLLFYPTPAARKNLVNEGIKRGLVRSGDLMYEILDTQLPSERDRKKITARYRVETGEYIFITLHRAENADRRGRLVKFIKILESIPGPKLFAVHPRTLKNLKANRLFIKMQKIPELQILEPLPYGETLALMAAARAVMTDSGGMQKEAYFLGTPCLTMRSETEWVETLAAGANTLVDLSLQKVQKAWSKGLRRRRKVNYKINGKKPSEIICAQIAAFFENNR